MLKGFSTFLTCAVFSTTALAAPVLSQAKTNPEVESLKAKIIAVAFKYMTDVPAQPVARAELNQLVGELTAMVPTVTQDQIVSLSPGSWRQVWSDERDNSPPGAPTRDLSQVYQMVSNQGWAYNFGVRVLPNGVPLTFALAAQASVNGNQQTTEITKAFARSTGLVVGESIDLAARQIHAGQSKDFVERNAGRFPNGPIGAKGILTILFLDEDLKVGTSPNVYDGRSEMFVLVRQDLVSK